MARFILTIHRRASIRHRIGLIGDSLEHVCDVDVIVTQVVGVQKASGDDEITYVIQPENGASIDLPDDQADLKWSLADGRSGTLRVEFYPYEPGPRCTTYGCDTMVSHSTPIPSLLLIFIVSLGIIRRRMSES